MTARSPSAFMLSASLHAFVVALIFLVSYTARRNADEVPKVFQLVAGEGNAYMEREAPLLGTPGGIKLETPVPPTPQPAREEPKQETRPEPVPETKPEPAQFTPAPTPTAPPKPKETPAPKQTPPTKKQTPEKLLPNVRRDVIRAESQAKKDIEKERKAEEKKLADERKRAAVLEAQNKAKNTAKSARVDVEGIQKGVMNGSARSKEGAGGKELRSDNDDVLGAYFEMFKERVREKCEAPPGLSDSVRGEFEFVLRADGSISGARVVKSSGNSDFDQAVLDAIRRVRMPPHPQGKTESVKFAYSMRDQNRG